MYGFKKKEHLDKGLMFVHEIFKENNEENFYKIQRKCNKKVQEANELKFKSAPEELQRKTVKNLFLVMPLSEKNLGDLVDDSQMEL